MLKVAYSPIYVYSLPEGHRFPMRKYELLAQQLLYEGTIAEDSFFTPDPFTDEDLGLAHDASYVLKLNNLPLTRDEERNIGFPVRPELIKRGRYIANGSLMCALHAMDHGIAMNIAGGTHHAFTNKGEGFCIFNDFALAARHLKIRHGIKKILIIDLDVHQGNGTAQIFSGDADIFTFSMHGERNYPLRKTKSDLDIGLPDKCTDDFYLKILMDVLPSVIESHRPEIALYIAGVDVLQSDKLGRLSLTREGCKKRDRYVFSLCKKNAIPVAVSMGGGYSHKISDIVEAHANTFRVAQELYF